MQQVTIPVMWDLKQAEIKTGLKRPTLTHAIKRGDVKFIRLGAGQRGKFLINAQSLCDYMQGVSE